MKKKQAAEAEALYLNPMTDFGFKKIFGQEDIMRAFLTDLLEPESPITTITFLDKEPQPQNKLERGVIYDLRCMTEDGGEFIVEMQNSPQEYFADRILYYLSRSIAPQGDKGKKRGSRGKINVDWDFNLKPVYGIFFLNFRMAGLKTRTYRTIHMTVDETRETFCDKVRAYTIELPGFKNKKESDCKTKLDKWTYNLLNMKKMTTPMPFQAEMPVFTKVASVAEIAKMTSDERRKYQDTIDMHRTNVAVLNYQYNEGVRNGEKKGEKKATLKNAKALKKNGVAPEIIAASLGLAIEVINKL